MKPVFIEGKPFVDAQDLYLWLMRQANDVHGKGDGFERVMNGGRVDAYWTAAAELQDFMPDEVQASVCGAY